MTIYKTKKKSILEIKTKQYHWNIEKIKELAKKVYLDEQELKNEKNKKICQSQPVF